MTCLVGRRFSLALLLLTVLLSSSSAAQEKARDQGRSTGPQTAQPRTREPHAQRPKQPPAGETARRPQSGDTARRPPAPPAQARPRETPRRAVPAPPHNAPPMWRAYPEPRYYSYHKPRVVVPCITYPRPYYAFRPRFWIGFGIYIGVPVPYPVVLGYPPYVYADGVVLATPVEGMYGGIAFTISPPDATVSVDGVYVGEVRDFDERHQPLTLAPGRHHIELEAAGLVPLAFEVDIVAGQVSPFNGTLRPY